MQIVSPRKTSKSRMAVMISGHVQRTCRTFRLLPLPGAMFLGTPPPFKTLLPGRQNFAVLKIVAKTSWLQLEVKADLRGECSRRHVVCAAERRKKVIQSILIGKVDAGQL